MVGKMKILVTSAFAVNGKINKPNSQITVDDAVGRDLVRRGKATEITASIDDEPANDEPAAKAEPVKKGRASAQAPK